MTYLLASRLERSSISIKQVSRVCSIFFFTIIKQIKCGCFYQGHVKFTQFLYQYKTVFSFRFFFLASLVYTMNSLCKLTHGKRQFSSFELQNELNFHKRKKKKNQWKPKHRSFNGTATTTTMRCFTFICYSCLSFYFLEHVNSPSFPIKMWFVCRNGNDASCAILCSISLRGEWPDKHKFSLLSFVATMMGFSSFCECCSVTDLFCGIFQSFHLQYRWRQRLLTTVFFLFLLTLCDSIWCGCNRSWFMLIPVRLPCPYFALVLPKN